MSSVNPVKWLRSSSFRLALVYMSLFGGSVLLLLTFIYWSTARHMGQQADATIEAEIAGLAERYQSSGIGGLTKIISKRISRKPGGHSIYLLADSKLRPLLGNITHWPNVPEQDGWLNFLLEGEGWPAGEIHRARARAFKLRGGMHLLVGRDLHELEKTEQLIIKALVWGLAITLVLGLVGGSMMTRSLVRRIEAVNQTSREIMSGDLSQRIPRDYSGDDFDELAGNLNTMLDRITALMEEIHRISDNIAHDLKTPLSRLKNSLELLQVDGEKNAEDRAVLVEASITEADGLLSTFNALLRISRIESGERRAAFTEVDLHQLVQDLVGLYAPVAEEKQLFLTLNPGPVPAVRGDRDLLFQTFANLLDNAIKYTSPQGRIMISLSAQNGHSRVEIADSGPGIPEQERDKVLRRFYRLEASRGLPGNGLGLSLVAAVTKLHELELRFQDNNPGLKVIIEFPRQDGPSKVNCPG